jgi:hypothetical protein
MRGGQPGNSGLDRRVRLSLGSSGAVHAPLNRLLDAIDTGEGLARNAWKRCGELFIAEWPDSGIDQYPRGYASAPRRSDAANMGLNAETSSNFFGFKSSGRKDERWWCMTARDISKPHATPPLHVNANLDNNHSSTSDLRYITLRPKRND